MTWKSDVRHKFLKCDNLSKTVYLKSTIGVLITEKVIHVFQKTIDKDIEIKLFV